MYSVEGKLNTINVRLLSQTLFIIMHNCEELLCTTVSYLKNFSKISSKLEKSPSFHASISINFVIYLIMFDLQFFFSLVLINAWKLMNKFVLLFFA